MTINIFVFKGDLNGKIVVVRFFFCWVYINIIFPERVMVVYYTEQNIRFFIFYRLFSLRPTMVRGVSKGMHE